MNLPAEWEILENYAEGEAPFPDCGKTETLFSLANGHLGMRGDFEEREPARQRGTYVNGFFETEPIVYGETAYGYARNHQTMLNLPDGRVLSLVVDGVDFSMTSCRIRKFHRGLDLRRGSLERQFHGVMSNGAEIELTVRRFVSLTDPDLACLSYTFRLNGDHKVQLRSEWDLESKNLQAGHDPRVGAKLANGWDVLASDNSAGGGSGVSVSLLGTRNSRLFLACGAQTVWEGPEARVGTERQAGRMIVTFDAEVERGQEVKVYKYLVYRGPLPGRPDASALKEVRDRLDSAKAQGFEALERSHVAEWERFWRGADVEVGGDPLLQQALRFNLFHMFQSAGKDGRTNLAAKGLSGEGYEGHYFWDTEIYALPLFTYTSPDVARELLGYRYSILGQARERAKELGHQGALFPWRTIDGREASAYYPAGTAQYHINADIVYASRRYALVHDDVDFLAGPLAEIAFETARFWISRGDFVEREDGLTVADLRSGKRGRALEPRTVFCLNVVTGPDEYTALVDNNVFTNLMASENLSWAAAVAKWLKTSRPSDWSLLVEKLSLKDDEPETWADAASRVFVPYDFRKNLFPQDDSFFHKAVWDVNAPPKALRPLLLHYHPLDIYRFQVLKQPDLVLAQYLLGDFFTPDEKKRHFAYYEPLTTGDSSLSYCIQSILAAETGDVARAWEYFRKTVRMDLDDLHGNARDGIHAAAMAGSWLSMIYGFGGFREHYAPDAQANRPLAVRYTFHPVLPPGLERLKFRLRLGPTTVECDTRPRTVTYRRVEGPGIRFFHDKKEIVLSGSDSEIVLRWNEETSNGGAE